MKKRLIVILLKSFWKIKLVEEVFNKSPQNRSYCFADILQEGGPK